MGGGKGNLVCVCVRACVFDVSAVRACPGVITSGNVASTWTVDEIFMFYFYFLYFFITRRGYSTSTFPPMQSCTPLPPSRVHVSFLLINSHHHGNSSLLYNVVEENTKILTV